MNDCLCLGFLIRTSSAAESRDGPQQVVATPKPSDLGVYDAFETYTVDCHKPLYSFMLPISCSSYSCVFRAIVRDALWRLFGGTGGCPSHVKPTQTLSQRFPVALSHIYSYNMPRYRRDVSCS